MAEPDEFPPSPAPPPPPAFQSESRGCAMVILQLLAAAVMAGVAGALLAPSGYGLLLLPAIGIALCFSRTWRIVGIGMLLTTGIALLLVGICISQFHIN